MVHIKKIFKKNNNLKHRQSIGKITMRANLINKWRFEIAQIFFYSQTKCQLVQGLYLVLGIQWEREFAIHEASVWTRKIQTVKLWWVLYYKHQPSIMGTQRKRSNELGCVLNEQKPAWRHYKSMGKEWCCGREEWVKQEKNQGGTEVRGEWEEKQQAVQRTAEGCGRSWREDGERVCR